MKVLLFGASGMVGQGVLRECLLDPDVTRVTVVGRSPLGQQDPKLTEIIHADFFNFEPIADSLKGFDACFFCLGVSSFLMKEPAYHRITYDITLAAARLISKLNPQTTFTYVSGQHTDSSEKGDVMWARVKGKTENALLKLPLRAYMFRPGLIQAMHGVKSKTLVYLLPYLILSPFIPFLLKRFPTHVTTSERMGRAMLALVKQSSANRWLENADINALGAI